MKKFFASVLLLAALAVGLAPAARADSYSWGSSYQGSNRSYRNLVKLTSDVVNNNASADTIADVTGLSFKVAAGVTYHFYAVIPYTSAATTTGSRWSVSGPTSPTLLNYTSRYTAGATSQTVNFASAYDIPAASNSDCLTAGDVAVLEGVIIPSASGTVTVRFASEVSGSAVTAKAGATLEWW